jgi:hypothetical protein
MSSLILAILFIPLTKAGTRHLSKFWAKAGSIGGDVDMTLDKVLKAGLPNAE